ncbi:MAG TPA: alpha/beta fold hydrolase [Blastocatellia bacterium]|nr:alpha/beta fold hydrolase [Blastocatellia bacterium]
MLETRSSPRNSTNSLIKEAERRLLRHPFETWPALRNGHAMTIFCNLWRRRFRLGEWPDERRLFRTEPETQVVAHCHWQPDRQARPTVILVHGLEGCADRPYILGTAEKALRAGFNVIRQNVRNCGGTEHLTPTLYHSGLTDDLHAIVRELIERDGLPEIYVAGFSMGGNQALRFAGELADRAPAELRGIVAVSPAMDLAACCDAISRPQCRVYEERFLSSLKARMRLKEQLHPGTFDLDRILRVRGLREFDDVVTGPYFGFGDSNGYYASASSRPHLGRIRVPTLVVTAQDDPFIPFEPFRDPGVAANPHLLLLAPRHGGHVGFFGRQSAGGRREDPYWAENRAVQFCALVSRLAVV